MFYRCNTCDINICPFCKSNHYKNHKIINYDDKNFICDRHDENFISYCEDCKKNLCTLCDGHKSHKKINFIDAGIPDKYCLNKIKEELRQYIDLFNKNINMIIDLLQELINKMNIYYKINEDIINNY